jgi:hypothetical protein
MAAAVLYDGVRLPIRKLILLTPTLLFTSFLVSATIGCSSLDAFAWNINGTYVLFFNKSFTVVGRYKPYFHAAVVH